MKALLKREFFILRHNFIPYLCILALMPMAIYICISYPMHTLIKTHSSGINYLHWSSIGNMIFSSSVIGYLISLKLTLRYTEETNFSHAMLASPISNMQHLLSILIWSSIVSFIQLLFSIVITQSLNNILLLSFRDFNCSFRCKFYCTNIYYSFICCIFHINHRPIYSNRFCIYFYI